MGTRKSKNPGRLFDSPNPLVKKMGDQFFNELPNSPGVFFLENKLGHILYVSRAKSLADRIDSLSRVRPLEVARRTRHLLFTTENIRWEKCPSEAEAQQKENAALRHNKPRFNTVRTRKEALPFISFRYRTHNKRLHFKLLADPGSMEESEESQFYGAFLVPGQLRRAYASLIRLLWYVSEAEKKKGDFDDVPALLFRLRAPVEYQVRCEARRLSQLQAYMGGVRGLPFLEDLAEKLLPQLPRNSFHFKVVFKDLQVLLRFYVRTLSYQKRLQRFHKLGKGALASEKEENLKFLDRFI